MRSTGTIYFEEVQQFRQPWLWTYLAVTASGAIALIVYSRVAGRIPYEEMLPSLFFLGGAFALLGWLFYITRLETTVTDEGVFIRWVPFLKRGLIFSREQIMNAAIRKSPWMQYGYRWWPGYGTIHHVSGRDGIQLQLENGKRVFIGSQQAVQFLGAIHQWKAPAHKI